VVGVGLAGWVGVAALVAVAAVVGVDVAPDAIEGSSQAAKSKASKTIPRTCIYFWTGMFFIIIPLHITLRIKVTLLYSEQSFITCVNNLLIYRYLAQFRYIQDQIALIREH
jgi:hypothetical protein